MDFYTCGNSRWSDVKKEFCHYLTIKNKNLQHCFGVDLKLSKIPGSYQNPRSTTPTDLHTMACIVYTHRHTWHTHTGTEPRNSYTEVQPRHTEVHVTSKLCLNSQWPVSLVPPDELGGGKCFQTSSEHGGTDWLCVSDVFNFLLLQQLFWLPLSATYTFKGVAVTFLFELKIAE